MHTFMICIPGSKEEAKFEAVADRSEVLVFSGRSGHEGAIGIVAVLYRGSTEKHSLRKFLDREESQTMFKAELLSLSLAAELLRGESQVWSLTIGVDSQATICATGH